MSNRWLWPAILIVVIIAIGSSIAGTYNSLVALDQSVQVQWAQVQTVYQRRADLIPNLVATVKGVAGFEKSTYIAVAQARSKVGQIAPLQVQNLPNSPQAFAQFQRAQDGLSAALSRLLAVVENYPDLKANQNFLDLQAQLEGTENRIAVERRRYNESARAFNVKRQTFPTNLVASLFGGRFPLKPYFQAQPGAENAPTVQF